MTRQKTITYEKNGQGCFSLELKKELLESN
jgi:hypothetical protein